MEVFEIKAIGHVRDGRSIPEDDNWEENRAVIELDPGRFRAESLLGLDQFSHAEIIFVFDQVRPDDVTYDARHPRGRRDWPKAGIFAQRGKTARAGSASRYAAFYPSVASHWELGAWMPSMAVPFWT